MVWLVTVLLVVIGVLLGLLLFVFLVHLISPYPGAWLVKSVFDRPYPIGQQIEYAEAREQVEVLIDNDYSSKYRRNQYDIYYPKQHAGPLPIVIWVHGGEFVGGDKSQLKEFGTNLASKAQVAVVTLNYSLAPRAVYPQQLEQLDEAYRYLLKNTTLLETLDFTRVMFGGDSAGAQIAAQYVAVQTNLAYAREMSLTPAVNVDSLKGFMSYCGALDLKQMLTQPSNKPVVSFLYTTIARSLIGTRHWKERPELKQASIVDDVTERFPPSFITDGNTYSFETQGQAFVERLEELKVPVTSLFFTNDNKQIIHEYQFMYDAPEGQLCLLETVQFIRQSLML